MPGYPKIINRIIDANINRAKEGLRVCEEITRFILDSSLLTAELKKSRHDIDRACARLLPRIKLLQERNALKDVGRHIHLGELERKNYKDIFFANIQRVKESIRVLEEFTKLKSKNLAVGFKKIRYRIYATEKKAAGKIASLRHRR